MTILKEGIETFLSTYKGMFTRIEDAVKKKQALELEHASHALKGVVKNFCVEKAAQHAYEYENAGKNGTFEGVGEEVKELGKILNEIEQELLLIKERNFNCESANTNC